MPTALSRRSLIGSVALAGVGTTLAVSAPAYADMSRRSVRLASSPIGAGSTFYDTRALQYLLLAHGYRTNWEQNFAASTVTAVRSLQRAWRLPVTGVGDQATLNVLCSSVSPGTNSYRVFAIQTLLKKHGYHYGDAAAPSMDTHYYNATINVVRTFQLAHGLVVDGLVGPMTWAMLLSPLTVGPAYALQQANTGPAQWTNCGPTSAVAALIAAGKTPRLWGWDALDDSAAVQDFRYRAMGLPNTPAANSKGTWVSHIRRGVGLYGMSATFASLDSALGFARTQRPFLLSGDAHSLPWLTRTRSAVSHWITVIGYNGTSYLAIDPISAVSVAVLHPVSASQLSTYVQNCPKASGTTLDGCAALIG